jgi:hypothetical protein
MGSRTGYIKCTRSDKTNTFAGNISVTGTSTLSGAVTCNGALTIKGNLTFGDAVTDTLTSKGYATFQSGAEFHDKTVFSGTPAVQIDDNKKLQFEGAADDLDALTISCDSSGDATLSVTAGKLTLNTSDNVISAAGETITASAVDAKVIYEDATYTSSGALTVGGVALLSGAAKLEMTLANPGAAGKTMVIYQKDSGIDGHTVTSATADGFRGPGGTGNTLTFNAQDEIVSLISVSSTQWAITYISGAAVS